MFYSIIANMQRLFKMKGVFAMKKIISLLLLVVFLPGIPLSASASEWLTSPIHDWVFHYNRTVPGPMKTSLRNQLGTDYRPLLFVASCRAPDGEQVLILEHENTLYTVCASYAHFPELDPNHDKFRISKESLDAFFEGDQKPGGWTIAGKKKLPTELAPAYKALLGKSFLPMLHCGTQVVANGTNYVVLCMSKTKIFTVTIHIGTDGKYYEVKGQRKVLLA